jgi:prefoldin subunit 5
MISFVMVIHLSNMLIAIMGDSFSKNNQIKESQKRKQQLQFAVDNWWIDPIQNKDKVVFIVAGFQVDIENDDSEKFERIQAKIDKLETSYKDEMNEVTNGIKRLEAQLSSLLTENEKK